MLLSKKIRSDLINANQMKNYFKYAFGEIILVVVGILIALYIKGIYVELEQIEQIEKVGKQIVEDLRNDTSAVNEIIKFYEPYELTYKQVIGDSLNMEELKACERCRTLVTIFQPFIPNTNGYNLLKNFEVDLETAQDSLVHKTRIFYNQIVPMLQIYNDLVKNDVTDNLKDWKDNQEWYSSFFSEQVDESYYEYVSTDPIYKNKVANFYLLLYDNYLKGLDGYAQQAAELANEWSNEINKSN